MGLFKKRKYLPPAIVSIYFGVPGSGKTTFAAWLARHDLRRHGRVWSNVPITGTLKLEPKSDIGHWMICEGRVIIDEAGLEYNNREWKEFSRRSLYFFKYHRHYRLALDFFSQGWNDCDVKIRTLAQRFYVVKKSLIPFFVYRRQIRRKVGISDMTKDIIDEYSFVPFSRKYIFCPPLWRSFNTLSREVFPEKEWETW